jgi:glyoxylase-like metal-dependent hydrolase (beta-lactamase superfamily II)
VVTDLIHRRSFLRRGLMSAAALSLAGPLRAQPAVRQVAPGIRLISGAANGLVFTTGTGTILVDVPAPDFGGAGELYGVSPTLINTNWRPEHTAANDALGLAGARIVAHENTRLWMTNDFTVRWEDRRYEPRAVRALPNDTFYTSCEIETGDETIELGHLDQAHTDGDIYVFFRGANVLAVSDLLAVDDYPVPDYSTGGWIGGFRSASERLLELADDDTLIVPGVGSPQRRSAIAAQLELCDATFMAVSQAYANALSLDELLAAEPLAAFAADRGDPALFVELAYRGAWGHIRELGVGVV